MCCFSQSSLAFNFARSSFFQQRSSVDNRVINAYLFTEESDCVDTGTIKRIYSQRRVTVLLISYTNLYCL